MKSFLGDFYRHLATFYWSHCLLLHVSFPTCSIGQLSATKEPFLILYEKSYFTLRLVLEQQQQQQLTLHRIYWNIFSVVACSIPFTFHKIPLKIMKILLCKRPFYQTCNFILYFVSLLLTSPYFCSLLEYSAHFLSL